MFLFAYNLLFQFLLVSYVVLAALKYAKNKKLNNVLVILLMSFHFFITIISAILSEGQRSDSNSYFVHTLSSDSWFSEFGISTTFIEFIIYPLIHFLKLNYLSVSLIFGTFGIIGFLILYQLINLFGIKIKLIGINIIFIIIFLPSYHVWMSSIGKDSLVFMLSMLLLDSLAKKRVLTLSSIAILIFLTFIRPYIGVFTIIALAIAFITDGLYTAKRILLFVFVVVFGLIISFQLFNYLNIDITSFFEDKLTWLSRYSNSRKEGSFIDPLDMNVIEKAYSYLYRPLFYDANSVSQILVSMENIIFLLLSIKFLSIFKYKYLKTSLISKVIFFYCIIFLLVQSHFIYNLGLANRQKYMILPFFLYLLFYLKEKRIINIT